MTARILAARRQLFLKRAKEVVIRDQTLYHGSPTEGLAQLKRYGSIRPQEHGILPGEWFCVSPNDNMLRCFADGEDSNGMVFEPEPLRCLKPDWMHFSLASWGNCDFTADWLAKHPEDERLAYRLGYVQHRGDLVMTEHEFRSMIPEWVDGVVFPWSVIMPNGELYFNSWNDAAEIALTEKGCGKIWSGLNQLVVRGEWVEDVKRGWRKILSNDRKLVRN